MNDLDAIRYNLHSCIFIYFWELRCGGLRLGFKRFMFQFCLILFHDYIIFFNIYYAHDMCQNFVSFDF